jgi:DNA-binding NtrC family response regulator
MARILVVEDDPSVLSLLTTLLRTDGHDVLPVSNGKMAQDVVGAQSFDLMVSDIRMSPVNGLQLLKHVQTVKPGLAVIMMTGYGTVETAVEAMKEGAFDYITKPFKVDELLMTVRRALEFHHVMAENQELRARLQESFRFENLVSVSAAMRQVCERIARVAPGDATVLIQGESGTGKELVAKAIHGNSNRRNGRFIAINCAALPEPLLESELFGHVKGAFTGASGDKMGLFQAAADGTLMLDEIGSMPLSLQSKLLRVLEEKEVRRVGDTETVPVNARVLAATNELLEDQIKDGKFREDLYYRLNVITIDIPPLRERREDILPLTDFLLRKEWPSQAPLPALAPDVQLLLERYDWPGNVRELENALRHACTFVRDGVITCDVLPARILSAVREQDKTVAEPVLTGDADPLPLKHFVREQEYRYIRDLVNRYNGNKRMAAKALKISLATLYRKIPELEE